MRERERGENALESLNFDDIGPSFDDGVMPAFEKRGTAGGERVVNRRGRETGEIRGNGFLSSV